MASGIRNRSLVKSHPDEQFLSNSSMQDPMNTHTNISLPGVDAEKLKQRLYSYAPKQAPVNTRALVFNRPTNAQVKRTKIPSAPKLEPLVSFTTSSL